jgi:hypothetical protein
MSDAVKRRGVLYWLGYFAGLVMVVLIGLEGALRVIVPESRFWVVSNVYRAADNPTVGYTLAPNQRRVAFSVDLATNSLGYRGADWTREKPPGVFRVALIGDSHAFGFGVPFDSTMGEQLRRLLEKRRGRVEVLNFGVPGYNTFQEQAVLKLALEFSPDAVVFVPCNNDADDAQSVDAEGFLVGVSPEGRYKVLDRSTEHLTPPPTIWRHSRLYLYVRLLLAKRRLAATAQVQRAPIANGYRWMGQIPPGQVPPLLQTRIDAPLRAMIAAATAHGARVVLAPFAADNDWRRMFAAIARDTGVPSVELLALFPEAQGWNDLVHQFSIGWDTHLNALAHARFAAAIAEKL